MSNTDYSQKTLAEQKSAQTVFAGALQATADAAVIPNLVRMGGGADASKGVNTTLGATVAGATKVGQPVSPTVTTYSISRAILAAIAKKNSMSNA
jgi:hypothetical protein